AARRAGTGAGSRRRGRRAAASTRVGAATDAGTASDPSDRVAREELTPALLALELVHAPLPLHRPPVEVVIEEAAEHEEVHQRLVEEELLEDLQRREPQEVADVRREVVADAEAPALLRRVDVAGEVDLLEAAHAESALVRHPDEADRHRVEAHELRRDGVHR